MPMVTFLKANLLTMKPMGTGFTSIKTVRRTEVSGRTTSQMDMVSKSGTMEPNMTGNTETAIRMVKAS